MTIVDKAWSDLRKQAFILQEAIHQDPGHPSIAIMAEAFHVEVKVFIQDCLPLCDELQQQSYLAALQGLTEQLKQPLRQEQREMILEQQHLRQQQKACRGYRDSY